jgi:hypothetical protein
MLSFVASCVFFVVHCGKGTCPTFGLFAVGLGNLG